MSQNETRAKVASAIMNAFEDRQSSEEARRNIMRGLPSGTFSDDCRDCAASAREIEKLKRHIEGLESLRPGWAQGYTSDSMAAQASTGALTSIWQMLGVTDQTAAMQRLQELLP